MELILYAGSVVLAVTLMIGWYSWRDRQRPAPPPPSPSPDLIRISQRAAGYPMLWEIEGHRYWSLDDIASDPHRALAIAAVRQLMHQLPPEAATSLPSEEQSTRGALPEPSKAQGPAPAPPPASPVAPASPPLLLPDEAIYTQPFWRRFKESLLNSPSSSTRLPSISNSSFAMLEQIDDLFQENLRRLPDAPDASVRAAPDGGMQIVVAGRVYHSVDAIPHPAVADALRQAVKSWEAQIH